MSARELTLAVVVVVGATITGCIQGGPSVDHSDYATSCDAHDECHLYVLENVCDRCAAVPIAEPDWERAEREQATAQAICVPDNAVCDTGLVPRCVEGECAGVPVTELDGGIPY